MGMSTGGGEDEPMMDINTTPLIDILLVLLIMFIITIPVMTHAVKLDMPRPNNAPVDNTPPVVINLEIDFDGTILWNGTPVPDIDTLDAYFRREAALDPQPELHIYGDGDLAYRRVVEVMSDAARAGVTRIGFVTDPKQQ